MEIGRQALLRLLVRIVHSHHINSTKIDTRVFRSISFTPALISPTKTHIHHASNRPRTSFFFPSIRNKFSSRHSFHTIRAFCCWNAIPWWFLPALVIMHDKGLLNFSRYLQRRFRNMASFRENKSGALSRAMVANQIMDALALQKSLKERR